MDGQFRRNETIVLFFFLLVIVSFFNANAIDTLAINVKVYACRPDSGDCRFIAWQNHCTNISYDSIRATYPLYVIVLYNVQKPSGYALSPLILIGNEKPQEWGGVESYLFGKVYCDSVLQLYIGKTVMILPAYPQDPVQKGLFPDSAAIGSIKFAANQGVSSLPSLGELFVFPNQPCGDYPCDSLTVRRILDLNGLDTVKVESVSSSANGRISSLFLEYSSTGRLLPRKLTYIPPEIGNLSSLRSLFLDGNDLTRLPDSIVLLHNLAFLSIANNRITSLPDSIVTLDSIRCIYIGNNEICSLSTPIAKWIENIWKITYCQAWEPAWPQSQRCTQTSNRFSFSGQRFTQSLQILRERNGIVSCIVHFPHAMNISFEVFDCTGRKVCTLLNSPAPSSRTSIILLNTKRYRSGAYVLRFTIDDNTSTTRLLNICR